MLTTMISSPNFFYLTSHDDFFDSQMKVLFFAPSEVWKKSLEIDSIGKFNLFGGYQPQSCLNEVETLAVLDIYA